MFLKFLTGQGHTPFWPKLAFCEAICPKYMFLLVMSLFFK